MSFTTWTKASTAKKWSCITVIYQSKEKARCWWHRCYWKQRNNWLLAKYCPLVLFQSLTQAFLHLSNFKIKSSVLCGVVLYRALTQALHVKQLLSEINAVQWFKETLIDVTWSKPSHNCGDLVILINVRRHWIASMLTSVSCWQHNHAGDQEFSLRFDSGIWMPLFG